jgi:hypothetical protein
MDCRRSMRIERDVFYSHVGAIHQDRFVSCLHSVINSPRGFVELCLEAKRIYNSILKGRPCKNQIPVSCVTRGEVNTYTASPHLQRDPS